MRGSTSAEPAELTEAQAAASFDAIARREMGLTGSEFLEKWDAGAYEGVDLDSVAGLVDVWMALPLVR